MTEADLFQFFSSDSDLLENWHVMSGKGITTCTEDTWAIIEDLEKHLYPWGYFAIDRNSDIIPLLTGFFIYPEFRGKIDFWNEVNKHIGFSVYIAGVYNKNIPANRFLSKQGRIFKSDELRTFYLIKQEK